MNNRDFWEEKYRQSGRWLGLTNPFLYCFKPKDKAMGMSISIMDLRKDLPLLMDWTRPVIPGYIRSIHYPLFSDYQDLLRFYIKEMTGRLRLFPFVVKSTGRIILYFDCLQEKRDKKECSYPKIYVFFHYPQKEMLLETKDNLRMAAPFIVDFMQRTMGRRRTVFVVPLEQDVFVPFLIDPEKTMEILPPSPDFLFWRIFWR
ncbi:MAG: hypothetical protein DI598_11160 [Pseudopedobacter saltans]|uniref:Uncharacterized protein n=1 Tax=Pseudopedobacter saltans TaxID=151895 RepID=A0A2W5ET96_9SPHI|nr:MAG: hypothetical protein DI598_11160 [Pseudopedobacter saltans]